jgi:hypothetical protein
MPALNNARSAIATSNIELILTPHPRAGYAGIKSRVGFRMITPFPENGHTAGAGLKAAASTRVFRSVSTGAAKCSGWFSELCLSGATGGTDRANLEAHRFSNFL